MLRLLCPLLLTTSLLCQGLDYVPVVVQTFSPSPTQPAPTLDNWSQNVFRPFLFEILVSGPEVGTNGVLRHGVRAADEQPPTTTGIDRNQQGMRSLLNLNGAAQVVSIRLYVPSSWQNQAREAALWTEGLVLDTTGPVVWAEPRLSFRNGPEHPAGFYCFDQTTGLESLRLPVTEFDRWYTLAIRLRAGLVSYFVDGQLVYQYLDDEYRLGSGLRASKLNAGIVVVKNQGLDQEVYWDDYYGSGDFDNDGLDDRSEDVGPTSPVLADTDADGLLDGAEVDANSNPLVPDTDGDGLLDGEEVNQRGTDPTRADTDGDMVNDRLDDRPLVRGVSAAFLSLFVRDVSVAVTETDTSLFVGNSANARRSSRNRISNRLQDAAIRVEKLQVRQAESKLEDAYEHVQRLMLPGASRDQFLADIQFLRELLAYGFGTQEGTF
ncbi:MAG: hypothetical protein RL148_2598 [Planctomycetota bacterium]